MSTNPHETVPKAGASLEKGVNVVASATTEVIENDETRDSLAKAVLSVRNSLAYKALTLAWNILPAGVQRTMLTNHTELGAFILRYMPMAHPEAYFVPGQMAAAFIQLGLLDFNLTDEENTAMEEALGIDATESQKMAYRAEQQEALIAKIVTPGEGYTDVFSSKTAGAAAKLNPELEPFVLIGKAGGMLKNARDSLFQDVRARVHQLEVEAREKNEVEATEEKEHDKIAEDLRPQVDIPLANNTDHFEEAHNRAA